MTKLTEVLRKHVWCIIIDVGIILTALLIYDILTEAGASEIFGTISAVVSIILGIVVIFYMFYQSYQSAQSIDRIRDLVSEAPRLIAERTATLHETTGRMTLVADSLAKMMPKLLGQDTVTSKASSTPTAGDVFDTRLNFATSKKQSQGLLYAITKVYKEKRSLPLLEISEVLLEEYKIEKIMMVGFLGGMLTILASCLEGISFDVKVEESVAIVKKLPEGFAEYIEGQARKILDGEEGEAKKILQAIDSIFV